MLRTLTAGTLALHGLIHLIGFVVLDFGGVGPDRPR